MTGADIHTSTDASSNGKASVETIPVDDYRLTDTGNAEALVHLHGHELRYCHGAKTWHVWDRRRWAEDVTGELDRRAKDTARWRFDRAAETIDSDERGRRVKWALKSESAASRANMITLAQSEPGIPVTVEELDADPWLLNVGNGTIDLRDGTLKPHDPTDLLTQLVPHTYDPQATCGTWLDHLHRVFAGDSERVDYLQRLLGMVAAGQTREHKLIILHGGGENGKTVTGEAAAYVFGEYAAQTPAETLIARDRGRGAATPDLARLRAARFVSAAETGEGRRLDEALVKSLTGSDRIACRHLYSGIFEYVPRFTIFLATNHKPEIRGTDHAIWRRVDLVPFTVKFTDADRDRHITEKLNAEASGILTWIVEGCAQWQKHGLNTPTAVTTATSQYREDMDILGTFLTDCCDTTGVTTGVTSMPSSVTKTALYEAYTTWAETAGEKPVTLKRFTVAMRERGHTEHRTKTGRTWLGITLKMTGDTR